MKFSRPTITLVALIASAFAHAGSMHTITYQGRIVKPNGVPVTSATNFRFKLKAPNNCVLWQEDQTLDLSETNGAFSAVIGSGTNAVSGSHPFKEIFNNTAVLTGLSGCVPSGGTFGAALDEDRILQVSFNDGSGSQDLPDMPIKNVPFANFASKSGSTTTLFGKVLSPLANPSLDGQIVRYDLASDSWIVGSAGSTGVTFVDLAMPSIFSVGSAVTGAGTLSATLNTQAANMVFAGPSSGGASVPTFRTLGTLDIPNLDASKITTGTLATSVLGVVPGANGGTVTQVTTGAGLTGGPINTSGTISLATTAVGAGSYGGPSWIPTFVVDAYGRLTSAATVAIAIDGSQITTGTIATAALGVVPGANGGTVTQVNTGAGLVGGPFSNVGTIALGASGVSAGTYGSSSWVPNFIVDIYGRLTSAGSTAISISATQITSGTLSDAQRGTTGVSAGSYGTSNYVPTFAVDQYGRLTAAGSVAVASSGGTVQEVVAGTGLTGGTISLNGTIGLANSGVVAGTYGSATYIPTLTIDTTGRITTAGSVSVTSSQWVDVSLGINYGSGGSVGIGVAAPVVKLDVAGAIKIANDSAACAAGFAGAIRYNGGVVQYCDGVGPGWVTLGISGAGLQSLNGLAANHQIFAVDSVGTLAAFASSGSIHTLSIPMASTAGAVGGLLSNADYLNFLSGNIFASRITGTLGVDRGGTGLNASSAANGALLIGNGSGFSLSTLGFSNGLGVANLVGGIALSTNAQVTNVPNTIVTRDGSGSFAAGTATLQSLVLQGLGTVGLSTPTLANYSMVLPFDIGLPGQVLQTDGTNQLSWRAVGTGSVTQVNTGAGLIGGPFSTVGTISLAASGVSAGSLGNAAFVPQIIVDTYGRITGLGSTAIAIDGSQVTAGTLGLARIPNLNASILTTGTLNTAQIGQIDGSAITSIAGSSITSGTINLAQLGTIGNAQFSGTLATSQLGQVPASLVSTGTLNLAQVGNIQASQITTGTLNTAQIGQINGSAITSIAGSSITSGTINLAQLGTIGNAQFSGTLATSQLGQVPASLVSSGTLNLAQVGNIQASQVTSGTLNTAQIGQINGSAITSIAGSSITSGTINLAQLGTIGFSQIAGTIAIAQHGQIPASLVTSGTLNLAQVGNIQASQVTSGTFDFARLGVLNASILGAGTLNTAQIGQINGSAITNIAGSSITSGTINLAQLGTIGSAQISGTLATSQLGQVPASLVTSGTLNLAQVGNIQASQVTSGTFDFARLGVLNASILGAGTLNTAQIGSINGAAITNIAGSSITSGTINLAQIGTIGNAQISGTLATSQLGQVPASLISSGTLNLAQVGNIQASQITSGTLNTAQIGSINGAAITNIAGSSITSGTINLAQFGTIGNAQISGTLATSQLGQVPASLVSSGTLNLAQVGNIQASQVTSGTFDFARLGVLNASILGAGTLNTAQIGQINGSAITNIAGSSITSGTINLAQLGTIGNAQFSGTLAISQLGQVPASLVSSGTLNLAQIGNIQASQVTSGTFDFARLGVLNASILGAGTLNTAQIGSINGAAITNIAGSSITSGTINLAQLGTIGNAQFAGTLATSQLGQVPASLVSSGTLNLAQVGNIQASQVTSGTLDFARLGVLNANILGAGTLNTAQIGQINGSAITNIAGSSITSGTINLAQLGTIGNAQFSGTLATSQLGQVPASLVSSGTLNLAQVGNIQASQVTSGSFALARIPTLPATYITSGTLALLQIGSIQASQVTSGTFDFARLGVLNANILGAGTLNTAQIGSINGSAITSIAGSSITSGTINLAQLGTIGNAQFSGTLATSQLGQVPASLVSSGTLNLAQVGNIQASQVTSGTFDFARIGVLNANILGAGTLNTAQIGQINGSAITNIAGSSITSGTINLAQLGTIGFNQIAGTIAIAQHGQIPASLVSSGTLNLAQVGDIQALQVTSGSFALARIPTLPASYITSGTLALLQVGSIQASQIASGTLDFARLGVLNVSILGAGTLNTAQLGVVSPTFPLLSTTLGSVGTPVYSFLADQDTGLFSPGANTLAISTAGSQRLTIDSGGNVGIGTSVPNNVLEVRRNQNSETALWVANDNDAGSSGVAMYLKNNGGNPAYITLPSSSSTAGTLYQNRLNIGASNSNLGVSIYSEASYGDFKVYTGGSTSSQERFRITSGGSVGIGTQAPAALFDVNGASRSTSKILAGGGTSAILAPTSGNYSLTLPTTPGLLGQVLSTAGTTGILSWVTAPVNGGTFLAASGSAATPGVSFLADQDTGLFNPGANTIAISTAGSQRLTVDSSGNVGIGTATPFDKLVLINSANAGSAMSIATPGTQNSQQVNWSLITKDNNSPVGNAGNKGWQFVARGDAWGTAVQQNDFLISYFDGSSWKDPITIDAPTGNTSFAVGSVGIGTQSPAALFDVNGPSRSTSQIFAGGGTSTILAPSSGNYSLTLPATPGLLGQVLSTAGTTGVLSWSTVPSNGGTFLAASGSAATPGISFLADQDTGLFNLGANTIAISTGGSTRLAINDLGNVGIGTSTPDVALQVGAIAGSANPKQLWIANAPTTGRPTLLGNWQSTGYWGIGPSTGSADNSLRIGNITGSGSDWALTQNLNLEIGGSLKSASQILAGAGTLTLLSPLSGTTALRFPSNAGTSGQVLSTDGTGNLSWTSVSAGITFPLLSTTLGSAAAPAYSFSADSNTGLYSPSAGTLAFTIKGSNKIYITPTGLGIGNSDPASPLHIMSNAATTARIESTSNGQSVNLRIAANDSGGVYRSSYLSFTPVSGTNQSRFTIGDGTDLFNVKMNGQVGIGTINISSGSNLEVYGGAIKASAKGSGTGNGGEVRFGELLANGTNWISFQAPDSILQNYSMILPGTIGAAGQVLSTDGVGTLSWVTPSSGVTFPLLSTTRGSVATPAYTFSADSNSGIYSLGEGTLGFSTDGNNKLILSNNGVGINSTNPNGALEVKLDNGVASGFSGNGAPLLNVNRGSGNSAGLLLGYWSDGVSDNDGAILTSSDPTGIVFATRPSGSPVIQMKIAQSGAIGMGTTSISTGSKLEINGGALTLGQKSNAAQGAGEIRFNELMVSPGGTNFVAFRAPDSITSNVVWQLPSADGASGQSLVTNGAGTLSWATGPLNGGTFLAASGSAATPGISFNADQDTGLWNPGANTLAISTAGTTRLVVNNLGQIGIGGTPTGNGDLEILKSVPGGYVSASIYNFGTTASTVASMELATGSSNARLSLQQLDGASPEADIHSGAGNTGGLSIGAIANAPIVFHTNTYQERLRITGGGSVGVGTASPAGLMHIKSGTGTAPAMTQDTDIIVQNNALPGSEAGISIIGGTIGYSSIAFGDSAGQYKGYISSNNSTSALRFGTNTSDKMMILSDGKIGMGTASVSSGVLLEVQGGAIKSGNGGELRLGETLANGTNWVSFRSPSALAQNYSMILPGTIGTAGQVLSTDGAGTLSWITAGGSSSFPLLSTTLGSVGTPVYSFSADTDTGIYSLGPNTIGISTAGTLRVAVDNLGKVGIGTSTPGANLEVVSPLASAVGTDYGVKIMPGINQSGSAGYTGIYMDVTESSTGSGTKNLIDLKLNGTSMFSVSRFGALTVASSLESSGWIGAASGYISSNGSPSAPTYSFTGNMNAGVFAPTTNVVAISTTSTERMRIDSVGNVGIGTTAVVSGNRLEVTGGAIASGNGGELKMNELLTNGTNWVSFRAPSALAQNYSMILPGTIGTAGQVLSTDGAGTLSWVTAPSNGGTFLAANGSATAPGFAFNSDTDNGMYLVGANSVGFSTGGTLRMALDNSGYVGIGISAPQDIVHAHDGIGTSSAVLLTHTGSGSSNGDGLRIQMSGSSALLRNMENGYFRIDTNGTERLRVTATGSLGIGTGSPSQLLDVAGVAQALSIYSSSGTAGSSGYAFTGDVNTGLFSPATDSLVLATSGTSRISVNSLGNVGIGTTNPGQILDIQTSSTSPVIHLRANSAGQNAIVQLRGGSSSDQSSIQFGYAPSANYFSVGTNIGALSTTGDFFIYNASLGPALTVLQSNNNVGIGTSTPQARLDIVGTGTAASSILIPRDTTVNRPPGIEGMIRYNSTLAAFEGFQGTNWVHFSSTVSTDTDAMTAVSVDFSNSLTIDATGTSGACGTLTLAGMTNGGTYTLTMPNATTTCSTITVPGGMTLKTPVGYTAGQAVTGGVVYTFIRSGNNIWMSSVLFQ